MITKLRTLFGWMGCVALMVTLLASPVLAINWIGGIGDYNDPNNWEGGALPDVANGDSAEFVEAGDNPQIDADLTVNPRFILITNGTVNQTAGLVDFTNGGPELGYTDGTSTYNLSGGEMRVAEARFTDVNIGLFAGGNSTFNLTGTGFLNQIGVDGTRGVQIGRGAPGQLNMRDTAQLFTAGQLRNGGDDASGTGTFSIHGDGVQIDSVMNYTQNANSTLDLHINGISPINTQASAVLDGILQVNFLSAPSMGDDFTIITTGTGVEGTFAAVSVTGAPSVSVNYAGGDGNDVVLTVVPEPSVLVLATIGSLLLVPLRRRK